MGDVSTIGLVSLLTAPDIAMATLETTSPADLDEVLGGLEEESSRVLPFLPPEAADAFRKVSAKIRALKSALEANDPRRIRRAGRRLTGAVRIFPGTSRFDRTEIITGRIRELLESHERTRLQYRATTLYLSPQIGGGSLPIRHGLSATVPFRNDSGPRVLFVSLFPLHSNGSGTWTKAMADYVGQNGGEARVLFLGHRFDERPNQFAQYLVPFTSPEGPSLEGAAQANLPVFDSNPASRNGKRFGDLAATELEVYTEALADAVAEATRHMKPDILVVNHAWVGAEAAKRTGIPYVVVCHGTCSANMSTALQSNGGFPENTTDLVLPGVREADRVVAITEDVEGDVQRLFGVAPDRTLVISNGFDSNIFRPQAGLNRNQVLAEFGIRAEGVTHVVTFAGRMVDYKGVGTLLQAAKILNEEIPGVHFILAGDGNGKKEFEQMARQLGIGDVVHFIGQISLEQSARLHAIGDLGVVPSWREPFGIVPLEIAGVGTPVIATNVGGLRQTVSAEVGVRVPPKDPHALARAMLTALQTDLKGRLGMRASRHVHQKYPWEVGGDRLFKLLLQVVSGPRRSTGRQGIAEQR